MATAYKADTYADQQINNTWTVGSCFIRPFSFNIATNTSNAGFIINDTVSLCPLPYKEGVLVVAFDVEIPSLDGGTSVRASLGDTNGTSNAFQATWYSAVAVGGNAASIMTHQNAMQGTTIVAKNGTAPASEMPHQYTVSTLYSGYTAWPTIDFQLKITTAPNTATTTGTIKGWLMLQALNSSAVTF